MGYREEGRTLLLKSAFQLSMAGILPVSFQLIDAKIEAGIPLTDAETISSEGDVECRVSDDSDVENNRLAFDEIREETTPDEDQESRSSAYSDIDTGEQTFEEVRDENIQDECQESSSSDNSGVNKDGLVFDEIREEAIRKECQDKKRQRKDKTDAFCDVCFTQNIFDVTKNTAFYLCYLCEKYLCHECFENKCHKGRESHKFINLVREKSEIDEQIDSFLDEMMSESQREAILETHDVSIVDIVKMNHKLDVSESCEITGVCGLNNATWVVSDSNNLCIKIFSLGSNILQRYIRFGPQPYDVTEMTVKHNPIAQGVMSANEYDTYVTNRSKHAKQCVLAVTLPLIKRIFIIDVTHNPAVKTNSFKADHRCYNIGFSEDRIFTVCYTIAGHWCVSVMSTDGVTLKTINTDMMSAFFIPDCTACNGRVYIINDQCETILCMDAEGIVSQNTVQVSGMRGISVDPNTNNVYTCSSNSTILRIDSSLENVETLFTFKKVNGVWPINRCFYRDKLYVCYDHGRWFLNGNSVTVVRVL